MHTQTVPEATDQSVNQPASVVVLMHLCLAVCVEKKRFWMFWKILLFSLTNSRVKGENQRPSHAFASSPGLEPGGD